jgi:hypothetical protein
LTTTIILSVLLLAADRPAAAQANWADRLGYPPGSRVLMVYAAQMGTCFEANQAGTYLQETGLVQSLSGLPPCPWFEDFAQWCQQHPEADVGVGLTMTSEWNAYRWQPVSARGQVPSLVNGQGYLPGSLLQFSLNASAEDVRREIESQIRKATAAGLRPSHLLPHLGALLARPDLAEIYLATARKHWIPAVMVELTPAQVEQFRQEGLPLDVEMIELIARYPLPKVDDLKFFPDGQTYEEKRVRLLDMLRGLQPGITQVVALPAEESDALKRMLPDQWQQRVWDRQLLRDPEVTAALAHERFTLTNWREMMRRFEGRPGPDPAAATATTAP